VSRHWDPFSVAPPPEPLPSSDTPVIEGNRWDDAYGKFSSLYAATTAAAAFGETISRYREKADLIAKIDAFLEGPPDPEYNFDTEPGVVPSDYLSNRRIGRCDIPPWALFVDVDHAETHAHATRGLASLLTEIGFKEFDRGVMMSPDRRVTRPVASFYHHLSRTADEMEATCGLRYESRLAGEWECWSLWEPLPLDPTTAELETVTSSNPDLISAVEKLGLRLPK
jgi:hypothetical protein